MAAVSTAVAREPRTGSTGLVTVASASDVHVSAARRCDSATTAVSTIPPCTSKHNLDILCVAKLGWHVSCLRRYLSGHLRFQQESKDDSSVSLRSRIREAQREVVKRLSLGTQRPASDQDAPVTTSPKSAVEDETYEAMPTVEEIRTALLRKSTNGKRTR